MKIWTARFAIWKKMKMWTPLRSLNGQISMGVSTSGLLILTWVVHIDVERHHVKVGTVRDRSLRLGWLRYWAENVFSSSVLIIQLFPGQLLKKAKLKWCLAEDRSFLQLKCNKASDKKLRLGRICILPDNQHALPDILDNPAFSFRIPDIRPDNPALPDKNTLPVRRETGLRRAAGNSSEPETAPAKSSSYREAAELAGLGGKKKHF